MFERLKRVDYKTYSIMIIISILMIIGYNFLTGYRIFNINQELYNTIDKTLDKEKQIIYLPGSAEIRKKIKLDDQLIVYFSFNNDNGFGWLELKKGLIFNYRFSKLFYSLKEYPYFTTIITTNKGKYLLIMGEKNKEDSQIEFTFNKLEYRSSLPRDQYYIFYQKIADDTPFYLTPSDVIISS